MKTASVPWYNQFRKILKNPGFWFYFPLLQAFQRYQHSVLGPIWMIIPTALFVILLGSLYSIVLQTELRHYMLHLAVGYVSWAFITASLVTASQAIKANKNFLMQGNIVATHIVLKGITSNLITLLHGGLIVPAIMIYFRYYDVNLLGILLASIVFIINALTFGIIFAVLGARFKDLSHLITSVMRVLFFATPIIWLPGSVRGEIVGLYLYLNPFYYYLEIIRAPFFGEWASLNAYVVTAIITLVSLIVSDVLYRRLGRYYLTWV